MIKRPEFHVVDAEAPARAELDTASAAVRHVAGGALDRVDHEALIALALGEDVVDDRILEEERVEAEVLRRALEGDGDHPLASLAHSLRHAVHPVGLDGLTHERLLRVALAQSKENGLRRLAWPIGSAIAAMAAGVVVWVASNRDVTGPGATVERADVGRVSARSTAALFEAAMPFPARGGESDRLGRIVASRASDLRANRFARWGVR